MAAPIAPDRKLASEVRRLALSKMKVILEKPTVEMNAMDKELHDAVLLKLAGSVLPRLQEITGEDGGELKITFDPVFKKDDFTQETTGSSPVESPIQNS